MFQEIINYNRRVILSIHIEIDQRSIGSSRKQLALSKIKEPRKLDSLRSLTPTQPIYNQTSQLLYEKNLFNFKSHLLTLHLRLIDELSQELLPRILYAIIYIILLFQCSQPQNNIFLFLSLKKVIKMKTTFRGDNS